MKELSGPHYFGLSVALLNRTRRKTQFKRTKQLSFQTKGLKPEKSLHGGDINNPQKRKRPLGLQTTMHFVLRSSKAKKEWSLRRHKHFINLTLQRFSKKYSIQVLNKANVGNHIHLHLKVSSRQHYRRFIRAFTASIAMKVTGYNRWNKAPDNFHFWDQRPFSRILTTWTELLNLDKYVEVNRWEGIGVDRQTAKLLLRKKWLLPEYEFL